MPKKKPLQRLQKVSSKQELLAERRWAILGPQFLEGVASLHHPFIPFKCSGNWRGPVGGGGSQISGGGRGPPWPPLELPLLRSSSGIIWNEVRFSRHIDQVIDDVVEKKLEFYPLVLQRFPLLLFQHCCNTASVLVLIKYVFCWCLLDHF